MRSRLCTAVVLLLATAPAGAVEYVSGQGVDPGAAISLSRQWQPLLAEGFDSGAGAWKVENFEGKLAVGAGAEARSGSGCLAIAGREASGDTAWGIESPLVSVPPGRRFRLSFWCRHDRDLRNAAGHKESYWSRIRWLDARGGEVGTTPFTLGDASPQWCEQVVLGVVPSKARAAVVQCGFDSPNLYVGAGVYLDDVSLCVVADPPRFCSGGEMISRPLRISAGARLSYRARVPAGTSLSVQVRTAPNASGTPGPWSAWTGPDRVRQGSFPQAGAPLPAASRAHAWAQYRLALRTARPSATPAVESVSLGKVTETSWSGPDRRSPMLIRESPGRFARADAPVRFGLDDGEGAGVDLGSLTVSVDGRPVTAGLKREADGTFCYAPPAPWTPVGIRPGFAGWSVSNHQGLLGIAKGDAREAGGTPSMVIRGAVGDTAFTLTSPAHTVAGGETYHLRFWSRHTMALGKADSRSALVWADGQGLPVGERVVLDFGAADPQWHPTEVTAVAPAGAKAAQILLGCDVPNIGPGEEIAFADVSLDGPPGTGVGGPNLHQITVGARDLCGNALAQEMWLLVKEPRTRGVVSLRDDGVTLVDGKPFFPIGIYAVWKREQNGNSFDRAFQELKEAGFNTAHTYNSARNEEFREFLASAARNGIKLFVAARGGANVHDPAAVIMDVVAEEGEDAILAWYLADDTASHIGPKELRSVHQALRDVDPAHVTVQADGVGDPKHSRYAEYVGSTDGFLPELYPIRGEGDDQVPCIIRDMKTVAADLKRAGTSRKAVWAIVQDFEGWGWPRFPTDAEERAMTYLSIIHGATGMTWYTYGGHGNNHGAPHDPKVWANLKRIAGELSQLQDVLVERDTGLKASVAATAGPARDALGYPSISTMVRKHAGVTYVLAANSGAQAVKARLAVPGLSRQAEVLFEGRNLPARRGALEDTFEPYGVHVYRW